MGWHGKRSASLGVSLRGRGLHGTTVPKRSKGGAQGKGRTESTYPHASGI